jgi:hypothetical protein
MVGETAAVNRRLHISVSNAVKRFASDTWLGT